MKKNNNKLWFKAKNYGWGWTPITWQGWAVTGLFLIYALAVSAFIGDSFENRAGATSFTFFILLGMVPLFIICYKKGEKPEWRWGKKRSK